MAHLVEPVRRGDVASDHIVQFFDDDRSLARGVASFLADGVATGDNVLVIASSSRWLRIADRLQAGAIDLDALERSGDLTVLDSRSTLDAVMRQGEPVAELFETFVGTVVRRLSTRPLRVYGDMVDVLAEEANFDGAQRLEAFWNELGLTYSFVLLCGYCSVHFGSATSNDVLRGICGAHTRALSNPSDELASWLLTSSGIHSPA